VQGGAAGCTSGLLISLWVVQEMTSWTQLPSWQTDLCRQQGQPLAEGDEGEHQGNQQQNQPQVAGLLQAVAAVMSRHQERLEQFRQRAFLSMSRNTSTAGTASKQQQQMQQSSAVDSPAQLLTAVFPETSSLSGRHQHTGPRSAVISPLVQLGSSRPQPVAEARESGNDRSDQPMSALFSPRPRQQMLENDGNELDEIEELQRQVHSLNRHAHEHGLYPLGLCLCSSTPLPCCSMQQVTLRQLPIEAG
jgi:hypothetical protein